MRRRSLGDRGPFLKWAGGKGKLLAAFERSFPAAIAAYHEPFLGAGAVFFQLAETGRIGQARLGDANRDLVLAYRVVKERPAELVRALGRLAGAHDERQYYEARARFNRAVLDDVERAAHVIYLNKTGFNGLYRVNAKGEYNVPLGRYLAPRVFSESHLLAASRTLAKASLEAGDFATVLERARAGDFVYLDPPYDPLSRSASFTGYAAGGFPAAEQRRLAGVFRELDRRGVQVMLSNHDTPLVRELYAGYPRDVLTVGRAINCRAERRSDRVAEVVVRNYGQALPVCVTPASGQCDLSFDEVPPGNPR